jgi:hypothetical protein
MKLLDVNYSAIKESSNILYLDHQGNTLNRELFEEELSTNYRIGMITAPVSNGSQPHVLISTPYDQNQFEIDHNFLFEIYRQYLLSTTTRGQMIDDGPDIKDLLFLEVHNE